MVHTYMIMAPNNLININNIYNITHKKLSAII